MESTETTYQCKSPVAFFIFNRPTLTERVFAEIARAKPAKLFVIADGARMDRAEESKRCAAARAITEKVDWDCEVRRNYSDANLGCKHRVSSGIDWVFEAVDHAIFLEDDCLPHSSFFNFCDEMLSRYRENTRITAINGANFQFDRPRPRHSYYFSKYIHVWGWATWRRAWRHYDVGIKQWPAAKSAGWLEKFIVDRSEVAYWTDVFDRVHKGQIDTWDYQWMFSSWFQAGLSIAPSVNLVSNIGFGSDGTHTQRRNKLAEMPLEQMTFPMNHPDLILADSRADQNTAALFFRRSLASRLKGLIRDSITSR